MLLLGLRYIYYYSNAHIYIERSEAWRPLSLNTDGIKYHTAAVTSAKLPPLLWRPLLLRKHKTVKNTLFHTENMQNNFILRFYIIFQVHEYAGRLRSMCISQVINQAQKTFVSFKDSHFLCLHCGDMTAFGSRCRSTFKGTTTSCRSTLLLRK